MSECAAATEVRSFMRALTRVDGTGCTGAERVDLLRPPRRPG